MKKEDIANLFAYLPPKSSTCLIFIQTIHVQTFAHHYLILSCKMCKWDGKETEVPRKTLVRCGRNSGGFGKGRSTLAGEGEGKGVECVILEDDDEAPPPAKRAATKAATTPSGTTPVTAAEESLNHSTEAEVTKKRPVSCAYTTCRVIVLRVCMALLVYCLTKVSVWLY